MLPPAADAELYIAIARVRAAPSANVVVSRASVEGAAIAAPTPCSARATSSQVDDWASPPSSEASGEEPEAGDEDAAAAEQVAGAGAEQEQPAEGQRVGVLDPGEAGGGEAEVGVDARAAR